MAKQIVGIIDIQDNQIAQDSRYLADPQILPGIVVEIPRPSDNVLDFNVEGRPFYYWVQFEDTGVQWVYGGRVNVIAGMSVKCRRTGKAPFRWEIWDFDRDLSEYQEGYEGTPSLPAHASDHVIRDNYQGYDPLYVYNAALADLKTYPISGIDYTVAVATSKYVYNNTIITFNGETVDLTSYNPGDGSKRFVLIALDVYTNSIVVSAGDVVRTGSISIPKPPTQTNWITSSLVKLYNQGQIDPRNGDIVDARFILNGQGMPPATALGQVLYSGDGISFTAEQPLLGDGRWLVNRNLDNSESVLLIHGNGGL